MKPKCKITQLEEFVATLPDNSTAAILIPTVIKSGHVSIWDYRVWSDGTKECWGTGPGYSSVTLSSSGYTWVTPYGIMFPFVYTESPIITAMAMFQKNWSHDIVDIAYTLEAITGFEISAIGGTGVVVGATPKFHVIGK